MAGGTVDPGGEDSTVTWPGRGATEEATRALGSEVGCSMSSCWLWGASDLKGARPQTDAPMVSESHDGGLYQASGEGDCMVLRVSWGKHMALRGQGLGSDTSSRSSGPSGFRAKTPHSSLPSGTCCRPYLTLLQPVGAQCDFSEVLHRWG